MGSKGKNLGKRKCHRKSWEGWEWREEGDVDGAGSRSQSLEERAEGDPERKDGKWGGGKRGEMSTERELCIFRKKIQEKLCLAGICQRPLLSLWVVCVCKCVGRETAVVRW